tara:strand:- start:575 stop:1099 length:525 start_codon:yes stop_codon:yes gene_type:complete
MKQHLLFPTKVYTDNVILDIPLLIDFLYNTKQADKGVQLSNKGGWQSKSTLNLHEEFHPLINYIQNTFQTYFKLKANKFNMWGNISSKYHYNAIHKHGSSPDILSGVYYLQTSKDSGCLTLHNNCDTDINQSFLFKKGDLIYFTSSLPHSVDANLSDQDRISIAFNFQISDING